jgi:hypothetical protein
MIITSAIDEIVNFIAGENPSRVLDFKASEETRKRVFDLIGKSKSGDLTEKEQAELDHYFLLEHLMRLAKIRAYQMLHS